MSRPHRQRSIGELECLVDKGDADQTLLREINDELRHRTTGRAKKLAGRTKRMLAGSEGLTESTTPPDPTADGSAIVYKPEPRPEGVDPDLYVRYTLLRETFTVESELLARWGMTTSLPRDLENAVFELWTEALAAEADPFGRTLQMMRLDRAQLALERIDYEEGPDGRR